MGLGQFVRITRPPADKAALLDKKAEVINLVPEAAHPLNYLVKVDGEQITLPADALEPVKIEREETKWGVTVNGLNYCEHDLEVCGQCGEDHRFTNFYKEYSGGDAVELAEKWYEGMSQIGAPSRKAPTKKGKKDFPGNPAVFRPVISDHLLLLTNRFNPSRLNVWTSRTLRTLEVGIRHFSAFQDNDHEVPEFAKLPVRRLRETHVALGRRYDEFLRQKRPNEPMGRMILQDDAQTQALNIDLVLPVREMEVGGVKFPVFVVRWMQARATDGYQKIQLIMETMERNTRMSNIPCETDEIDLMAAHLAANARLLDPSFLRGHAKRHMEVSIITPISHGMQEAHYESIKYCTQCGTSGCELMKCSRCRKVSEFVQVVIRIIFYSKRPSRFSIARASARRSLGRITKRRATNECRVGNLNKCTGEKNQPNQRCKRNYPIVPPFIHCRNGAPMVLVALQG